MGRRRKIVNNSDIPLHKIETIARELFPNILASYESEEGQREFADWKLQQEAEEKQSRKKIEELTA